MYIGTCGESTIVAARTEQADVEINQKTVMAEQMRKAVRQTTAIAKQTVVVVE